MNSLTAEERQIITLLEERTRKTMIGLAANKTPSEYRAEMLAHFIAQNKAYKIALEQQNAENMP